MNLDRNTVIGLVLIILILIGSWWFTKPSEEQLERMQHQRDSIAAAAQQEQQRFIEELQQAELRAKEKQDSLANADAALSDSGRTAKMQDLYGAFYPSAAGEERFITMENKLMKVQFSTKGGRPYSVELKNYKRHDGSPLVLFDGDSTIFGFRFFAQNRTILTNQFFFSTEGNTPELISVTNEPQSLKMRLKTANDAYIEYVYTMQPDNYMLGFEVLLNDMHSLLPQNQTAIDFDWQLYSPRQEKGISNENMYTSLFYKFSNDDVEELDATSNDEENISTKLEWVAFKQQFFSWALLANDKPFQNAELKSTIPNDQSKHIKKYNAVLAVPLEGNATLQSIPMNLYFGPNHYSTLEAYDRDLERLVPLGSNIIRWINRYVVIPLFNFLGGFIKNYGLIILLITIIIKLVLYPLTHFSLMSSAKMRALKPQIDEINKKYPPEEMQKRQQATMTLYQKAGVNPAMGCLPMLLQFPILFAMFRFFPASIELRQQSFLWATDLSTYDAILEWEAQIPLLSTFYGNHVSLFTLLMTAATIISMRMTSGQADTSAMPGMKVMMYFMPIMFMFLLNNYSAGLTYYYLLANLITIGQNFAFRKFVSEEKLLAKLKANANKPVKKSKWQLRLEEMQKQAEQQRKQRK